MAKTFFSLGDSEFKDAILQRIDRRSSVEIIISAVLYLNIITVLAIALAANGLTIRSTFFYLITAYCLIFFSITTEFFIKQRFLSATITSFLEASAIFSAIIINVFSIKQASPSILVISICMATVLTLPISTRSFGLLIFSKGSIILACIIYTLLYDNHPSKIVYIVFPLIILFFIIITITYWLYIRQIILLHQQFEAKHLKELLHERNLSLKEARDKLKHEHEIRDKMIRHIGHDLRQPINTLSYSIFNMKKGSLSDIQFEHMDIANRSIDTANYLIEDILQISTYQKNDIKADKENFSINELFSLLQREYQSIVQMHNITLSIVPCTLTVQSDIRLISRIMRNFLSNAIRHSQTKKIIIGVRRGNKIIRIQVIDQGIGFHSTTNSYNGLLHDSHIKDDNNFGLGLSIAKNLAKICNATIDINTKKNKGTTCTLNIPL